MQIEPYLFFDGRCEEAMEFYRAKLGAEVTTLARFRDAPASAPGMIPAGSENKVMHARFRLGDAVVLASDGRCGGNPTFNGFSLSVNAASEEEAEKIFAALSDGGTVQMPLSKTFFSSRFGMVVDRFGVPWMVHVAPPGAQ